MKKIVVIGCPGSGKSTFSKALHKKTGLPLYHLDMLFWNADKTTVPKSVFYERLNDVLAADEWIIDGNYISTMQLRLGKCDTVFFLDFEAGVCLDGVLTRIGKPRSDMPWVETEPDDELLKVIKNFENQTRPQIIKLLRDCSDKNIFIFKNRSESDLFLAELKNKSERSLV
ncbi:MAG: adenylate kinase [Clostridia bacterium]|nr:adenylate kinase [Clostridia bacterium]